MAVGAVIFVSKPVVRQLLTSHNFVSPYRCSLTSRTSVSRWREAVRQRSFSGFAPCPPNLNAFGCCSSHSPLTGGNFWPKKAASSSVSARRRFSWFCGGSSSSRPLLITSGSAISACSVLGALDSSIGRKSYVTQESKKRKMEDWTSAIKLKTENIVKSEEDRRLYRGLELQNGLKVLLISDPETDKSGAALDVHIGHLVDPVELPGLAHFCEHMLFMGTEKYPDENEYSKYLTQNGGSYNAFTSSDHTNYYFDVSPDKLDGALDRFCQFFVTPLFTESATDREVNAVNSEHEKNIANDSWRINQIDKQSARPGHDYRKFGTGNKETLDVRPKENGLVVREELLKFHTKWYSSNIMCLAILGQQDLDTLEKMAVEKVARVENKEVSVPEWTDPPFSDAECSMITYITPVKDIRNLNITWGIPDLSDEYKSNPGSYLGHLIGHEGPGSLLSELKSRGWVNNLVGGQKAGSKGFSFFVVNVDLTEEGSEHMEDIVKLVFQYLEMLRQEEPHKWVFEECRDLNQMQFRFKDKERPQSYVCSLAGHMHDYPIEDVLIGGYILTDWKPELISQVLSLLTPERVRISVIAKKFADKCDEEETYYKAKFKNVKISSEVLESWNDCGLHPNFRLPDKNDFIPQHFNLVERDTHAASHPTILQEDKLGRLWFMQDNEYLLPKTCINLDIRSPLAYVDPHHANMTYMLAVLFKDAMTEYVYAAELAGLGYSLANTKSGITIAIKGYSDKQAVLLEKILERLTNFEINEKRFEILKEAYSRGLKNFQAEQPHQHAVYYNSVLLSDKVWDKEELFNALDTLTVEEVQAFIPKLLSSLKLECLVYGNSTAEIANQIYKSVVDKLRTDCKCRPLLPSQLRREREAQLLDSHCIYETKNTVHKSSCLEAYFQCGTQSTRSNMLLELFAQIINESCYDTLRTKEQLGYIVFSGVRRSSGVHGLRIIVQSDKHPEYLETRIEKYLQGVRTLIQDMPDEEFNEHKDALATKRLEKPKKLSARNGRFWSEINSQHFNFNRDQIEVDCLKTLTKDDIMKFYDTFIADGGESRKKLSCHVLSTAEGGAGVVNADIKPANPRAKRVEDITVFKSSLPLHPLAQPFTPLENLRRE